MPKLSEQLRAAIEKADVSRYEISKATGVSQSTLSKFVLGTRPGISFDALDRIGEYLGLVIVKKQPQKKGAGRGHARQ
jgi:transcriptional regulator with XRE-family HTH domain